VSEKGCGVDRAFHLAELGEVALLSGRDTGGDRGAGLDGYGLLVQTKKSRRFAMMPDLGTEVIVATFLLLTGVAIALAGKLSRLRWPWSEQRGEQRFSEMSEVFRATAEWSERSEAWCKEQSRRRTHASP
jgi:hypothetical protein